MRYLAIAAVLAILPGACIGDDQSSSPAEHDLLRFTLQDEDVPAEIAILSEAQVATLDGKACLSPSESPGVAPSTLVFRNFDAAEPFPERGAQSVIVTSTLHASGERARAEWGCGAAKLSSGDVARLLEPAWHLVSYEEVESLAVGEDRKVIHYVSVNAEGLVFVETYWANFRRGEVTAVLNVRAPIDNISSTQFEALATKLDQRVQEGLLSLQ